MDLLRQKLDLYTCLRPVRYFRGVPSPVKRPELVDMVIFRENTEDIYAGVEWASGTPEVKRVIAFLQDAMVELEPTDLAVRVEVGSFEVDGWHRGC